MQDMPQQKDSEGAVTIGACERCGAMAEVPLIDDGDVIGFICDECFDILEEER